MGKAVKSTPVTGSNGTQTPLEPVDFLSQYGATATPFADVTAKETLKQVKFDPRQYEYVDNPSSLDVGTERVSGARQPITDVAVRSLKQFGANALGAIATSAMNSTDVKETFNILAGKEDTFNNVLFGVSTKDIMDWSQQVGQDNKIYENTAGNFDPSDIGWWGNQVASAGTGVGMAAYALGETAAITAATEGTGTIPELFSQIKKLPQLARMMKSVKNAEQAVELADLASKLKRTATTYAVMNRLNESKMEAQQTFQDSFQELKNMKNPDGTNKYSEEEARNAAAAGARRDFYWNMPLMALDILTYRTMVFNPFSGGGTGLVERGLERAAGNLAKKGILGKGLGYALPHLVGSASEGLEEGLQYVGSEEGKHYARVMSGLDDQSTFLNRLGGDVSGDEFWNNFAGGVIGSPIIGGTMKLFNAASNGRSQRRLAEAHKDFVANVGVMDSKIGQLIRDAEESGDTKLAEVYRRNFGANKALSALYLDSLKGSAAGMDAYRNFLSQTLEEVKNGKTDSLADLGFTNPTKEQIAQITENFQTYLDDSHRMERIFNEVSNQHEKQFVAPIAQQMFSLETRRENQPKLEATVGELREKVFGYNSLSPLGKEMHDINYKLIALNAERTRLQKLQANTPNPSESENVHQVLKNVELQMERLNTRVQAMNTDDQYTTDQREADASILNAPTMDSQYFTAIHESIRNASQINLESRDLALWNKGEYKNEQSILGIINSRTKEQLNDMEADLVRRGKMTSKVQEAINNKRDKLAAEAAIAELKGKRDDVANPTATNAAVDEAQAKNPVTAAQVETPAVTDQVQAEQNKQNATVSDKGEFADQATQTSNSQASEAVNAVEKTTLQEVTGNDDLFSDAVNDIVSVGTEQAAQSTQVRDVKPEELSLEQLRQLPSDFSQQENLALSILGNIDFESQTSLEDGVSKILEVVNNKFIPKNKWEQVLKTKEKLIGNKEYFSRDYLEKYVLYTTKNFENLGTAVLQMGKDFNYGDKMLSKLEITNFDDLIQDGAGRVEVAYDGENVPFSLFEVSIDPDTKTAEVNQVKIKDQTKKGYGTLAYMKLGQLLADKGYRLESKGQAQHPAGRALWDRLVKFGYAKRVGQGRYEYVQNPVETPEFKDGPVEISFAPIEVNDNLTTEQQERLKNAVTTLLKDVTSPSFEDLVRAMIKQGNIDTADKSFNLLIKGWELSGYPQVDYRQVYMKIFRDPVTEITSLLGELGMPNVDSAPLNEEVVQAQSEAASEDVVNQQQVPSDFDNNGQPVYNYLGVTTEETAKKFAFLSVPYTLVKTVNPDGSVTIDKRTNYGELNEGDHVDSLQLLDPTKYTEGTPMQVMIPSNYMDIKVSVTNEDGTEGTPIPFGQYVAKKKLTPDSQEYKDKIPMIIYNQGRTNEKGVAFVHDVQWYNPVNFLQSKPGEMEQAIKQTKEMREEVLAAKGRPVGITITGKRETTFDGLRLPKGTYISLREANPDTVITVAKNITDVTINGKEKAFDGELGNTKPLMKGLGHDVRRVGTRDGKPLYMAFPIHQPSISRDTRNSIHMALRIFANAKNQNVSSGDKVVFDEWHSQILATSGIDIRSTVGLTQYLNQFITLFYGDNVNTIAQAEAQLKAEGKPDGFKYITINAAGGIFFGTLGTPIIPKHNGLFVNPNPKVGNEQESFNNANRGLDTFVKSNFLDGYQQHVHIGSMVRNKAVVQITDGRPLVSKTYKDFLLDNLQSDVRSLNIGTEAKPNYVTNVQPVITYESDSKLNKDSRPQTTEEVKREVVPEATETDQRAEVIIDTTIGNPEDAQANLEALRASQLDLITQARQELGLDFLNEDDVNLDDDLLSPIEMTEAQREQIAESIQQIAGLNPQQQSELIDFMYNQVAGMIEVGKKEGVSRDEVYNKVKESFEAVVKPLRKTFIDKVKLIDKAIDADPESPHLKDLKLAKASYNKSIQRINDIQANYKLMEAETQARVEKYTNIQKGILADEHGEEDADDVTDDSNAEDTGDGSKERNKEFGTDSLQENPDSKMTYAMRRFLGQIRKVDKDGNPAVGFLRLPVYVGSDTVASTVRDLLADVPSNFDVMMDKLEKSVPAHGWLRELIDRLQAANKERKNQFVTVMSNHRLSMKFSMISYDRKTGNWTTKVYDTFQSGLANQLAVAWNVNFIDSSLVTMMNEVYTLDAEEAQKLVDEYDGWLGGNVKTIQSPLASIMMAAKSLNLKKPYVMAQPVGELKTELDALKEGERMKFTITGQAYQITKVGKEFRINYFNTQQTIKPENVKEWLAKIGITMSDAGFNELMTRGLYHNFQRVSGDQLFTDNNGLFKILRNRLAYGVNSPDKNLVTGDGNPLSESVIKSLANLESNYNTSVNSPNGRDGGKSIFGFTAPKFITDRTRDLKTQSSEVVNQLASISFSKRSMWLDLLMNSDKFRDQFAVSHIGLTAMKELGKKVYKDNSITKLSDVDHELTKLIMFWDTKQGEVSFNNAVSTYGDSDISMRMATMFAPTMSDKSNMMLMKTAVLNLEDKHYELGTDSMPTAGKAVIKALYEQTVRPELMRMIKHAQLGGKTNINKYDKGAKMFLFMPDMNYIKYNEDLTLIKAIENGVEEFDLDFIEGRPEIMEKIYGVVSDTLNKLVAGKITAWDASGFFERNPENNVVTNMEYMDSKYKTKFTGSPAEIAKKAAIDFEVNSMISTANSFMMYAGDPAIYFKSSADDYIQMAKDTFVNVGKRLANQIAPGTTIANSENEKYIQVFLDDRKSLPEIPFLKFATRVNDGKEIDDKEIAILQGNDKAAKKKVMFKYPRSAGYFEIEGADAQEYTTWREHLSLLERLGKTSDGIFDVSPDEIQEARELFASYEGGKRATLTAKQEKLIGKVLQPMKPVYTGQVYDADQDAMRTMYIKSSSFPLIPQLTGGLEIDKLRIAMDELEKKSGMSVRASYQTANKVGSVNNPVKIWNDDGTINTTGLGYETIKPRPLAIDKTNMAEFLKTSSLVLDRKNFRIQQDVPFKSGKKSEDKITLGTQLMKILFGNGVIDFSGFKMDGKEYDGKELHREYNEAFDRLITTKKGQLYDELGLNEQGLPIDQNASIKKLQRILKEEAVGRGYPIQDIEGLNLDADGNFITPLWSSANSNRYESMLNAIVTNRLVKIKFPGNSYVVGSEEGFKFQEGLANVDQSRIVWTSSWNGKGLQGSFKKNGQIEKAQVLAASKFRDKEGKLIDLLTKKDGEYVYVTKDADGKLNLKMDMFDGDLLSLTSFRIPTSGHVSAAQVEIVGFLPAQNADLMIVPRNFTKQMGLDFDVDKQNTYQLWHYQNPETGKFEVLDDTNKEAILRAVKGDVRDGTPSGNLMAAILGDDLLLIDDKLKAATSKLEEKLLQNKIIKIHSAILTNPNDKLQSKINGILSTDYAEAQADMIDALINKEDEDAVFTPLSSEYQKMKMGLGAAGKVGTGAYSLDVVFHSLVQQAKSLGNPLTITEEVMDDEDRPKLITKKFRFGNQVSDGVLGNEMTIDGDRSISEVLAELQNVALDNEKLQVMGRVGLNDLTIDVSKVFALLGFDKGSDEGKSSLQFLFLSQPIIRDYVSMMKNASSNMAEFSQDKEQKVVNDLLEKYNPNDTSERDEDWYDDMARRMTAQEMLVALNTGKPDGALQEAILSRFLEMKAYGVAIKSIQTGINTDAKGLGKSFFDVIAKKEAINKIGGYNKKIQNASKLLGDYVLIKGTTPEQYADFIKKGYTDIGNYLVKPTSLTGSFNVHAITSAYNLWSKHLPFDTNVANKVYKEIMDVIASTNDNEGLVDTKAVLLKQEIFRDMKKFFSANSKNGIVNTGDDVNLERKRLYIDSEENTSLAKYVKSLRDTTDNKVINNYIKSNKLINRFEFDIQKNGNPSLIKFNNAVGEEFDEQYLYNSLGTLLSANENLPDFNGKKYTTSMLAQDLIAYTYLGNSIQEAIQFSKYVPVVYNNLVGYSQFMREAGDRLHGDISVLGARLSSDGEFNFDSDFSIQFIQHNPERVKFKIPVKELSKRIHSANKEAKGANNLESFYLVSDDSSNLPKYVSIYNTDIQKGEKKFQLYMNQGDGQYKRIPVLGTFGMDEYNPAVTIAQSLVNGKPKAVVVPTKVKLYKDVMQAKNDKFGVNTGNTKTVLETIAKANITGLSDLARELAPYASGIAITYGDILARGLYNPTAHAIKLKQDISTLGDIEVARTILHETVHALTRNQIAQYLTESGGTYQVKEGAPSYVNKMVQLFNVTKAAIGEEAIEKLRGKIAAVKDLNAALQNATTGEEKEAIRAKVQSFAFTTEEKRIQYGAYDIYEFMALATTQPEFQKEMAKHEFKQSGQSLFAKFKEVLNSILKAIGVDYSENSVTAQAINSTFELITDKNVKEDSVVSDKYQNIAEKANGTFEQSLTDEDAALLGHMPNFGDSMNTGPVEQSFDLSEYPSVPNVNENNCY